MLIDLDHQQVFLIGAHIDEALFEVISHWNCLGGLSRNHRDAQSGLGVPNLEKTVFGDRHYHVGRLALVNDTQVVHLGDGVAVGWFSGLSHSYIIWCSSESMSQMMILPSKPPDTIRTSSSLSAIEATVDLWRSKLQMISLVSRSHTTISPSSKAAYILLCEILTCLTGIFFPSLCKYCRTSPLFWEIRTMYWLLLATMVLPGCGDEYVCCQWRSWIFWRRRDRQVVGRRRNNRLWPSLL